MAAFLDLDHCVGMRKGSPIAPGSRECVVYIHDADDLGADRDLVALEAVGITRSIVLLVVPPNDRLDVPGKLDRRQELETPDRVHLDHLELFRRQLPGLIQEFMRYPHLAEIV